MKSFHKTYVLGGFFVGINILRSVSHTLYLAGYCKTFFVWATEQLKTCNFRLVLEGFLCMW